MLYAAKNCMIEWTYTSGKAYSDPFNDVELSVIITCPNGKEISRPAFWAGELNWRFRFAPADTGRHSFRTECSDRTNPALHDQTGIIEVDEYRGQNPLLQHGPVQISADKTHFELADGTPFLWFADTWWMGLSKRLSWPYEFKQLTADRVEKGFSVVQIVAGLYPDMDPFDQRGENEAGFPWDKDFQSINPAYFDMADVRIGWLVESGIVPCIVGCWGYFMDFAGIDVIKKHWRYLIARYGAFPVVWSIAGEALMPFYGSFNFSADENKQYLDRWSDAEVKAAYAQSMQTKWTEVTRYVKDLDTCQHAVTIIHGRNMVNDPSILDFELMGGPHSSDRSALAKSVDQLRDAVNAELTMPVVNGEVAYEGICGTCGQEVQRYVFWANILNGAAGHTYGADGIWQLNTREKPFGPSPHGAQWGDTPWDEAARLPGSKQLGIGKKFFERFPWWRFETHPEWLEYALKENNPIIPCAAGIPGELRVIFIPYSLGSPGPVVVGLEKEIEYRAFYFDPSTGKEYDLGIVSDPAEGKWEPVNIVKCSPPVPIMRDMVMVLEKVNT